MEFQLVGSRNIGNFRADSDYDCIVTCPIKETDLSNGLIAHRWLRENKVAVESEIREKFNIPILPIDLFVFPVDYTGKKWNSALHTSAYWDNDHLCFVSGVWSSLIETRKQLIFDYDFINKDNAHIAQQLIEQYPDISIETLETYIQLWNNNIGKGQLWFFKEIIRKEKEL